MIPIHPPVARLIPRSTGQRLAIATSALQAWLVTAACRLAHAIVLVVPFLIVAGLVIAVVTAPARRRSAAPVAPAATPGLCGDRDPTARDACWNALFERINRDALPRSSR